MMTESYGKDDMVPVVEDIDYEVEDLDEVVEYLKERLNIDEHVDYLRIDLRPFQNPQPEVVPYNVH